MGVVSTVIVIIILLSAVAAMAAVIRCRKSKRNSVETVANEAYDLRSRYIPFASTRESRGGRAYYANTLLSRLFPGRGAAHSRSAARDHRVTASPGRSHTLTATEGGVLEYAYPDCRGFQNRQSEPTSP